LQRKGLTVVLYRQNDLQTADLISFQWALADLVRWCNDLIPGYNEKNYHIVFNLTGGFKSIQGFLQTLAIFYADEAIYVFESNDALLRLPKLPAKIVSYEIIERHLQTFRRLNLGQVPNEIEQIPETMLLKNEDQVSLSGYGQILWEQAKQEIYQSKVFEPAIPQIRFGPRFNDSVNNLNGKRNRIINERIDDLSQYFLSDRTKMVKRLDFKALAGNPKPPSTHEMDAWADQDARRIFGHFEKDVFILDELGAHL